MSASKRGLSARPAPGTKVRLTGYYLASTGQQTGSEGASRWLVVDCACGLCRLGRHCAVNEPEPQDMYLDLPPAERPQWRHFAIGNLQIVGAPPKAGDQANELPSIQKPFDR